MQQHPILWIILSSLAFKNGLCFSFYPPVNTALNDLAQQHRTFNNISGFFGWDSATTSNNLALNKSSLAINTGLALVTAFLIGHSVYTAEETSAKSKLDDIFDGSFLFGNPAAEDSEEKENFKGGSGKKKAKKAKKKARKQDCDCETYCTNKYYYGDGNYDASYASSNDYSTYYNEDFTTQTQTQTQTQTRRKRG